MIKSRALKVFGLSLALLVAAAATAQEATDLFGRPLRRPPNQSSGYQLRQADRPRPTDRYIEWDKESTKGWDVGSYVLRGVTRNGKHVCYLYFNGGQSNQMAMSCVPND